MDRLIREKRVYSVENCSFTATEELIFSVLYMNKERTVTKNEIITNVWPGTNVNPKGLDVHLHNIRRKLKPLGIHIRRITNEGYILNIESN